MGQEESRLARTVSGANVADVGRSEARWREGGRKLREVHRALEQARDDVSAGFGSGSSVSREAATAFAEVAQKAADRAEQMEQASSALARSSDALAKAEAEHRALGPAPSEPTPPERTPGMPESADTMRAEQTYGRNLGAYNTMMADRETRAKQRSDEVETTYTESTEVMRRIHGEPDERVMRDAAGGGRGGSGDGTGSGSGSGGGGGSTPSSGGRYTPTSSHADPHQPHPDGQTGTDPIPDRHPDDASTDQTSSPDTDAPDNAPSVLGQPLPPGSSGTGGSGGLTAGLGGGLAGSAVMGGAVVLGGRLAGGMGATPVAGASAGSTGGRPTSARPIGTGRTSGGATLGRGAAATGSPTGSRGGATGATGARGGTGAAGTRGAGGARGAAAGQAGSRGAGGAGRGAAGGATGRGKKGDTRAPDQEFFATEDDWTDDEGHQAVLD
ncbi:hypothetical protein I601_0349 [Nocardioides dokdonensis FR1436]|uniref:PPE family protein n=1 Tax=Nocardioides dokdonensis FR1436 TaxID=1300347 RepID=A0A1A9GGN5_9ACTN|nr:hypothetical protein [Nocardioides dokdonensis]ANH36802.1 hypothetical protein I601_0349 [Nocardioides dokdonensis FR1436]